MIRLLVLTLLKALSALLLFGVLVVGWLLYASSGLNFILSQVDGLTVSGVEGRVWGTSTISGAHYSAPGLDIAIDKMVLEWSPSILISQRQLNIGNLILTGVRGKTTTLETTDDAQTAPFKSPIAVALAALSISDIQWQHEDAAPITVDQLSGNKLTLIESLFTAEKLVLNKGPESIEIHGKLDVALNVDGPVDLQLKHTLGQSLAPNIILDGDLKVLGSWSKLAIEHTLSGGLSAHISGNLDNVLQQPSWDMSVDINNSMIPNFEDLRLDGKLQSRGNLREHSTQGNLLIKKQRQFIPAAIDITLANDVLLVNKLTLGGEFPFLDASGTVSDLSQSRRFNIRTEWQDLSELGKFLNSQLPASEGKLQISGEVERFDLNSQLTIGTEEFGVLAVNVTGQGSQSKFTSDKLSIRGKDISLLASIAVERTGNSGVKFDLRRVTGNLRGQAVLAKGLLEQRASDLLIDQFEASIGSAVVKANGRLGDKSKLSWSINIPDLAKIAPEITGEVVSRGVVNGKMTTPSIDATLSLKQLQFNDWSAESAEGDFKIGFVDDAKWSGQIRFNQISMKQRPWIDRSTLTISGTLADHHIKLNNEFSGGEIGTAFWDGAVAGDRLTFDTHVDHFPAQVSQFFTRTLPYSLGGLIHLNASGSYSKNDGLLLSSEITADALSLQPKDPERKKLVLSGLILDLDSKTGITRLKGRTVIDDAGRFELDGSAQASLLNPGFIDAPLNATVSLNYPDISSLATLLPADIRVSGSVESKSFFNGSLSQPIIQTQSTLNDGSISILSQGIDLENLSLKLASESDTQFSINGKADAGQGTVALSGTLSIDQPLRATLNLTAVDALVLSTPTVKAEGDAELQLILDQESVSLSGKVLLDRADIIIGDARGVEDESPDLIVQGRAKPSRSSKLLLNIDLDLGPQTTISASGLSGRLSGTPKLTLNQEGLLSSVGEIKIIDGKFSILGEQLEVKKGVAFYAGGAISNPRLDVEVGKTIDPTQVGIRVQGNADSPDITLFSRPVYPDQDIMALLFFEKPLAELGAADAIKLIRIANALKGGASPNSRFDVVQDSIANYLGIDKLDISIDANSNQRNLALTSKINTRLDIGYAYNFLTSLHALFLRYKLNQNWAIQSSVDVESGADLVFKTER